MSQGMFLSRANYGSYEATRLEAELVRIYIEPARDPWTDL